MIVYAARVLGTIRVGWLTLNKKISLHYFCLSYISSNLTFTLMSCRTHVRHLCISLVILWQSFYISFSLSWWYISRVNSNIIVSFFIVLCKIYNSDSCIFTNLLYICTRKWAGCSSARLEYASGGRVVAGSNPVIPT